MISQPSRIGVCTTPIYSLFSTTASVSPYQKGRTLLDFNEARDDGVEVASAGPYANHLHLVTQFFMGWMLFLTPNQQCRSTEGKKRHCSKCKILFHLFFLVVDHIRMKQIMDD